MFIYYVEIINGLAKPLVSHLILVGQNVTNGK